VLEKRSWGSLSSCGFLAKSDGLQKEATDAYARECIVKSRVIALTLTLRA